jgi:hypothetical protein
MEFGAAADAEEAGIRNRDSRAFEIEVRVARQKVEERVRLCCIRKMEVVEVCACAFSHPDVTRTAVAAEMVRVETDTVLKSDRVAPESVVAIVVLGDGAQQNGVA